VLRECSTHILSCPHPTWSDISCQSNDFTLESISTSPLVKSLVKSLRLLSALSHPITWNLLLRFEHFPYSSCVNTHPSELNRILDCNQFGSLPSLPQMWNYAYNTINRHASAGSSTLHIFTYWKSAIAHN
jgi:hypothetical protein